MADIHPTAFVDPRAALAADVSIGPFTVVYEGVELGPGSRVGAHCVLGEPTPAAEEPLRVGPGATIRSHSVLYAGSRFGAGLTTGHRVTVREGTTAGDGLQLGTLSDVQGRCSFGDHVRTHSNVHVCQGATVGRYVWLYPYVVLTNDPHPPSNGPYVGPTIEDFAIVATHAVILPGVRVGAHSLVAAAALATKDVAARTVVAGVPAKRLASIEDLTLPDGRAAYPWPARFHRGYPDEVVQEWKRRFSLGKDAA
jgi:acyl-[acyl carrier protein]--UDP-N-acetylglucosamine O-acyltransferase